MKPQSHILKCEETYFLALLEGRKNFEVRRNDRGFQTGDAIVVERVRTMEGRTSFVNEGGVAVGLDRRRAHKQYFTITYILQGGQFGIEPAFCVMGLRRAEVSDG